MPFLDAALAFYGQGGFPRQASLAHMLVGQVHDLRGEFAAAVAAYESQLGIAEQLEDAAAVAQARLLLGLALSRWERLPQALEQLTAAEAGYRTLAHSELAYCLVNKADALLRMGRGAAARPVLEELRRLVSGQPGLAEPLRPRLDLLESRLADAEQRLAQAATLAQAALARRRPQRWR
jgi:tetratricopeptide (TPR) repeat protein